MAPSKRSPKRSTQRSSARSQRHTLELQADRIEQVLKQHKVNSRVHGGTVTPRVIQFKLAADVGTKVRKVQALAEEIAMALGARNARIHRDGSELVVEVPRDRPTNVELLPLCARLKQIPVATSVLGLDDDARPLLLRLPAPDVAHILIAGTTGSGKTALLRSLLFSLTLFNSQDSLKLVLIDAKRRNLAPLERLPHALGGVGSTPEEVQQRLRWLVQEMQRRDALGVNTPRFVIAMDELADLIQTGGKQTEQLVTRLVQRGRQAGIHLIASTQKPTAGLIGSGVVANFPLRLVGMCATKEEARYATGISDSGAEQLGGRGDFLLIAKGEYTRFQAAWFGPNDLRQALARFDSGASILPSEWVVRRSRTASESPPAPDKTPQHRVQRAPVQPRSVQARSSFWGRLIGW